jgi:hypothetical protein
LLKKRFDNSNSPTKKEGSEEDKGEIQLSEFQENKSYSGDDLKKKINRITNELHKKESNLKQAQNALIAQTNRVERFENKFNNLQDAFNKNLSENEREKILIKKMKSEQRTKFIFKIIK